MTKGENIVSYFIKYFLLIFADGSTGPPVYVVTDGSVDGNDGMQGPCHAGKPF